TRPAPPPPPTCSFGFELRGGQCVPTSCPTGQRLEGATCRQIVCGAGRVLSGDQCVESQPIVAALPREKHWAYNGARLRLEADPNKPARTFFVDVPNADMRRIGVRAGALMFKGKRVHDGYVGEAYAFAAGCPPESYPVSGVVSADQRMVTLSGLAPTRNA